ncbi:PQQ-dependent sugar dehydrogenase [Jiangella alkaliphila]|uniref:Glucose/arabinose dehydrogenase, beta-propeller fold n=1 Tax=Jiangella alkaliphila TaxID=419479 RepID=A0A1H2JZ03_9ACTN|nr:Glucose/arabinose dehydrogenase, beta-propeller fold [Jiangella alkaliphila]
MRKAVVMAAGALVASTLVAAPGLAASGAPAPAGGPEAAPPDSAFQKVTLNDTPGEPMDLAVLPDGRVLHTTRAGEVWLHDPETRLNTLAAELDVYEHDEEGLQSIAIDPGFGKTNRWIYLYYSPPLDTPLDNPDTPTVNEGDALFDGVPADWEPFKGHITLARFQLKGDRIDLGTEQHILDVPVDRGICCHVGGDIAFDEDGLLYLGTGDDTNPFESDGFAPIDERTTRNPAFDAQRTSANTNDLRGKILRIKVGRNGGYTIPRGNLFRAGTEGTKPEIYAMGLRNPFRLDVQPETGDVYVGDYSPDAGEADPARGPAGQGKWTVVREPGNYGWPYCATAELPYVDFDFGTGASGAAFDCAAPVNESPHNTGRTELPEVVQPDIWYGYGESAEFPELGTGGIGPMGGPAYDYDSRDTRGRAPIAWPKYYDGVPLLYEWTRDWIQGIHLDRRGNVEEIEQFIPSVVTDNPMDLEWGPDGALYVLEYGDGYFAENPDAQLSRIDYIGVGGNHTPTPVVAADVTEGHAPMAVQFSSAGTADADGDRIRYEWDFDGDGRIDSREPNPSHTYEENGLYHATLKVTDLGGRHRGKSASAEVDIIVGNLTPQVSFVTPSDGDTFNFGDQVAYEVQVTDDQPVDCARVRVTYILGHDEHGHPQTTALGCSGTLLTTLPGGHDPGDNLTGVFNVTYTDDPGEGVPALTDSAEVVLVPEG